jgi:hypothetical protein
VYRFGTLLASPHSLGGFVMQQATVFAACKIARYLARGVRVTEGY